MFSALPYNDACCRRAILEERCAHILLERSRLNPIVKDVE